MSDQVTVSVTLPRETVEWLAKASHKSLADALVASVNINKLLHDAVREHSKVLLERPDGRFTRLTLPDEKW